MQRHRLLSAALALTLLAGACGGGGDDGASEAAAVEPAVADAPDATAGPGGAEEVVATDAAPGNPEGDHYVVRWMDETDGDQALLGLATTRRWRLTPTCDGDEPCDIELTGAGPGGDAFPSEFPPPGEGEVPPPTTMAYDADAEVWWYEEVLGGYGSCRDEAGELVDPDYTTMDETDRVEIGWDDDDRLVGTVTETYTLNDAGRANPACAPRASEFARYAVVLVPMDEAEAPITETVDLAEEYRLSRHVYSIEGTELAAPFDWGVIDQDTSGEGSCGPDSCDATLGVQYEGGDPQPLSLAFADGAMAAAYAGIHPCATADALRSGSGAVLTEQGYDNDWLVEVLPITVNAEGDQVLVARGDATSTPTAEARAQFPDDCADTEVWGAYWVFVPSDLVG